MNNNNNNNNTPCHEDSIQLNKGKTNIHLMMHFLALYSKIKNIYIFIGCKPKSIIYSVANGKMQQNISCCCKFFFLLLFLNDSLFCKLQIFTRFLWASGAVQINVLDKFMLVQWILPQNNWPAFKHVRQLYFLCSLSRRRCFFFQMCVCCSKQLQFLLINTILFVCLCACALFDHGFWSS